MLDRTRTDLEGEDEHVPLAAWLPILGLAVFGLIFVAYHQVLEGITYGIDNINVWMETGKVHWSSSSIILDTLIIVCLSVALLVVFRYPGFSRERWMRIGPIYAIVIVILVYIVLQPLGGSASDTLLRCLYAEVKPVEHLVQMNNVAGAFLLPTLILACICIIYSVTDHDCGVKCLSRRMRWYRRILYLSGALTAAATYQFFRLYHWGAQATAHARTDSDVYLSCLQLKSWVEGGALEGLASSVALGSGLVFSCALALVFVPPALVLNAQLEKLMSIEARNNPAFDAERWLSAENLASPTTRAVGSYVAVLLPAITGLLTKFIQSNIS